MELPPANHRANDRAVKTTRSNGMKLRLIETRLLTVKNNVNAFHGNERTYARASDRVRQKMGKTAAFSREIMRQERSIMRQIMRFF